MDFSPKDEDHVLKRRSRALAPPVMRRFCSSLTRSREEHSHQAARPFLEAIP